MNRRDRLEAERRTTERLEREAAAPRLIREIPRIASLRLTFAEFREDASEPLVRHIRHVVVARAPALFRLPCGDSGCADGGHDFTYEILRALRALSTDFHGQGVCGGRRLGADCRRKLTYAAEATYFEAPPDCRGEPVATRGAGSTSVRDLGA
jgi:hypothetical protein